MNLLIYSSPPSPVSKEKRNLYSEDIISLQPKQLFSLLPAFLSHRSLIVLLLPAKV